MSVRIIVTIFLSIALFSCGNKATTQNEDQIATPFFSPTGGTYDEPIDVLISSATSGVTIRYTIDGSDPTSESQAYSGFVHLAASCTLKAKAYKSGWIASAVKTDNFVFTSVAPPTISPAGGIFTTPQTVTMACVTAEAQIRYTINGTEPDQASTLYSSPIQVSSSTTLKSRAFLDGKPPSEVTTAIFAFQLLKPIFTPPGGYYATGQSVSITNPNSGAETRYTTDGTDPTEGSLLYTHPLNVSFNSVIKAQAFKDDWQASEIETSFYIINLADQMQLVNAGTFNNGSSNVTLSPFYIGKHEVTQLEWDYVMIDHAEIEAEKPITGDDDPLTGSITWGSAIEYCNKRSMIEGYQPCYNYDALGVNPDLWPAGWYSLENHVLLSCNWYANGYRLPTEMEWMYAAQAGNQSNNFIYSGSNVIEDVAWYSGNATDANLVGTKQANELGLYDMSGNVWEFCWDIYNYQYPTANVINPVGPSSGSYRVMRGGSWDSDASNCTIARRFYTRTSIESNFSGFRVARKG
ncbi:MAG: chitobiase/beta-hexosaminidase C-terminal domain-containing protein [Candidatus Cloacimonas sp.]|jgi:formylglycine-generating enzyme required for sulfatase activity|nr:chitobiase/beta-hexosaminidase C-terminal domain-containing protein [Candidatus Cloacimonas sp.]